MGILIWAIKKQKPPQEENTFRYSKIIIWLLPVCLELLLSLMLLAYFGVIGEKQDTQDAYYSTLFIFLLYPVWIIGWLYFLNGKITLTNKSIIKTSIFGKKTLPFDEIYKIVCHRSKGNPGAAMTKVYGKKKIILEAFLVGHNDLVNELRTRCKKAKFIEK